MTSPVSVMSIIREFYKYYGDVNTAKDFAPIAVEAIDWLYDAYKKHWNARGASGPVDWSGMPGQEFGFRPMDVQVISAKPDTDGEFYYAHLLTGEAGEFKSDINALLAAHLPPGHYFPASKKRNAAISFLDAPEPKSKEPYAVFPDRTYGNCKYTPFLYNLETGEVYYVSAVLELTKKGALRVRRKTSYCGQTLSPAFCINWITGSKHYVGYPVDEGHETAWALPYQVTEYAEQQFLKAMNKARNEILKKDPSLADASREKELVMKVKDEIRPTIEPVKLSPDLLVETVREAYARPKRVVRDLKTMKATKHQRPNIVMSCGPCLVYPFLEALYELKRGSLKHAYAIAEVSEISVDNSMATICTLLDNKFQSALQSKSKWFLGYLLLSIRKSFDSEKPIDPDAKTLPALFNMPKNDFYRFMDMDTPAPFVIYSSMNQVKPTSFEAFERAYEKIQAIGKELKTEAADPRKKGMPGKDMVIDYCKNNGRVWLKTQRGRIIMETKCLPKYMEFYAENGLQKDAITIYQFLKYIQKELRIARATASAAYETVDLYLIITQLKDYNRMAKEIIPSVGYSLPHNIIPAHDAMVANYNKIIAERKEGSTFDEMMKFAKCYAGKEADVLNDERFIVVAPENSFDLYDEGITLNHCVGSYGNDIMAARGSMLIYFLRNRKTPDRPLITVQVDKGADGQYHFTEVAGKGNRLATDEETQYLDKWLVAFNAAIEADKENNRRSVKPTIFNAELQAWLGAMGVDSDVFPAYDAAESVEENYRKLFNATLPIAMGSGGALGCGLEPDAVKKQLAIYVGKLKLPNSIMSEIAAFIDKAALA